MSKTSEVLSLTVEFSGPSPQVQLPQPQPQPQKSAAVVGANSSVALGLAALGLAAVALQPNIKRKLEGNNNNNNNNHNHLAMSLGRDSSYPDELNKLILPMSCQLCKVSMTSFRTAMHHYESKAHDRHISAWLAKHYADNGLQSPPPTKRQMMETSGAGFYNDEGNWVRTGTKATPTSVNDGRFGIGEQFIRAEDTTRAHSMISQVMADLKQQQSEEAAMEADLICRICNISVSAACQMKNHLQGAKHQRNVRRVNLEKELMMMTAADEKIKSDRLMLQDLTQRVPNFDLELYRTPTGLYYCKVCDMSINHVNILQQHLLGKKHQKAAACLKGPTL